MYSFDILGEPNSQGQFPKRGVLEFDGKDSITIKDPISRQLSIRDITKLELIEADKVQAGLGLQVAGLGFLVAGPVGAAIGAGLALTPITCHFTVTFHQKILFCRGRIAHFEELDKKIKLVRAAYAGSPTMQVTFKETSSPQKVVAEPKDSFLKREQHEPTLGESSVRAVKLRPLLSPEQLLQQSIKRSKK